MFKKIIAVAFVSVLLMGCSLFQKEETELKQAATEPVVPVMDEAKPETDELTRNFKDGDYYLKAVRDNNPVLCKKILNAEIEAKCEKRLASVGK